MGVLEAWKDAEKVGFPVVGEEKKDASNIIDYDIHEEITIDKSSVFNANNDTTTGMATVIPGINAPKLIADTSIVGIEYDQEGSFYGTLVAENSTGWVDVPPGDSPLYTSNTTTISSNSLPFTFTTDSKGLVFPRSGGYTIVVRFYTMGQSEFTRNDTIYLGNTVLGTHSGWSSTDITYQTNVKKGDVLWFTCYIHNSFADVYDSKLISVRYTITPK